MFNSKLVMTYVYAMLTSGAYSNLKPSEVVDYAQGIKDDLELRDKLAREDLKARKEAAENDLKQDGELADLEAQKGVASTNLAAASKAYDEHKVIKTAKMKRAERDAHSIKMGELDKARFAASEALIKLKETLDNRTGEKWREYQIKHGLIEG